MNPLCFIGRKAELQAFCHSLPAADYAKGVIKMKNYDELRFNDDFMFGKVMEDQELCREVLECLLQRSVSELTEVQTQRTFKFTSDSKPIRLDIYNEDSEGRIYNAEMQNKNNQTDKALQLPKRSLIDCFRIARLFSSVPLIHSIKD